MKKRTSMAMVLLLITLFTAAPVAYACTNLIITKGASNTGSVMICYTCDAPFPSHLSWLPGGDHNPGTFVSYPEIRVRGPQVQQVPHTYAVLASNGIGHMNEHQLAIGETTFGGRRGLNDRQGLHYADLITITLQRCKTAREAIKCIAELAAEYGYTQSGESFSIGDTEEAWIMDLTGNGPDKKGIVYVAVRIPDGHISCHANQSRISEFPLNDPENCIYSDDVVSVAVENGFYDPDSGKPFNFSDAYHPASARTKSGCAMRVWSMLNRAAPSLNLSPDYHRGVEDADRYPLSVKPEKLMSNTDVFALLRDHYEGTDFDMCVGEDAGKYASPYIKGGERAISIKGTVFSIVTQSRAELPDPIGGIVWYSPDDTYFSCYTPLYCGTTAVAKPYTFCDKSEFTFDSAWWTINFVANYTYPRYSLMKGDVQKEQKQIETDLMNQQTIFEKQALAAYKKDPESARQLVTKYTVDTGDMVIKQWKDLAFTLMAKYNDR